MPESFLEEVPLELPWKSTDSGVKLKSVVGFCGPGQVILLWVSVVLLENGNMGPSSQDAYEI